MNYTEVYFQFRDTFLKVYLSLLKIEDKTIINPSYYSIFEN
ncbi:hypothetical protein LEP1GSC173_4387 [Leptospira interrogans str. HAI1594]|uniref:Uncharacterized protein n=12 Tax=Leptospira interrogans TaxID=173 RepID=A0A0E2DHM1_LEPIR|nr:hypothetical protein G436_0480 [Leptospira interrogans serovar Hardjo str. Norma]EJO79958.1 hypothetical protein LEP1GSC045_2450 [Leptospira interrogans serovar Pomona str. Kennewicki LC82-25]EJP04456.1 hypothetical protein LEP1GSC007_4358 [Leptospira interrogans serovar Bulgarica str. Mallika]EJP15277.1 hypothetical protein LEP1GSC080_3766 [Leptospira interrogans str. FPW2026]EKN99029.1 hypothetical protein LEP1GSC014_2949 [Leptospira interrogans serovar Pomona str. Pomona]EKO06349.1 hypot